MRSNQKFKGKTVVITGASAGLARTTAEKFASEGANLGLISRNQDRLNSLKQKLESNGSQIATYTGDVANSETVKKAAEEVENKIGPIDIWINSAMVSVFSPVKEMEVEEYKRVTDVTYLGQVYGALTALKYMLPRNRGTIIFVGSALAYRGIPLQSAYCASKHAIQGFFDSLRSELLHDKSNIKITMVQLPAFNTPQFEWVKSRLSKKPQPVPPIYQPEIAAESIVWAAKKTPREVLVAFPSVKAIWGDKFFPGFGDKYLARQGYESQQTDEPDDPSRPSNLWETVPGDYGAHGRFDKKAKTKTLPFWLTTYLPGIILVSLMVLGVVMFILLLIWLF